MDKASMIFLVLVSSFQDRSYILAHFDTKKI